MNPADLARLDQGHAEARNDLDRHLAQLRAHNMWRLNPDCPGPTAAAAVLARYAVDDGSAGGLLAVALDRLAAQPSGDAGQPVEPVDASIVADDAPPATVRGARRRAVASVAVAVVAVLVAAAVGAVAGSVLMRVITS